MNFQSFDIIIVCNGYSKYLDACLFYWSHISYPRNKYRITIVTTSKDLKTTSIVCKYRPEIDNLNLLIYKGDKYNNKGHMLRYACMRIGKSLNDFFMFSDADMVFPPNFLVRLNQSFLVNRKQLITSHREDISQIDLDLFFNKFRSEKRITWVWDNIKREIISQSPFMGWFLACPWENILKLKFIENHKGYDVVDWKIYGQLTSMDLQDKILHLDLTPLHIYHGNKGSNWQGVELT